MEKVEVLIDGKWYNGEVVGKKPEEYGLFRKKQRVKYLIKYYWKAYSFITHSIQTYTKMIETYDDNFYFIDNGEWDI